MVEAVIHHFEKDTKRQRPVDLAQTVPFLPDTHDALANLTYAHTRRGAIDIEISQEKRRPEAGAGMDAWVRYFDTNWASEGLPRNWYDLVTHDRKHVGFVIDRQIEMFKQFGREDGATKFKRDLQGFKLEFLTDHNVYVAKYKVNRDQTRLEDHRYGKGKDGTSLMDIVDTVSEEERKGSVKASIKKAKEFLLANQDGLAVMVSPLGETGFKTQDGRGVKYQESYLFVMQRKGDEMINYTIKTDFKLPECRALIKRLTGKDIPEDAPLESYVEGITLLNPGDRGIQSVPDIIDVLERIQPDHSFADKKTDQFRTWQHVRDDVLKGEDLYAFDLLTDNIIEEGYEYCRQEGLSDEKLQKGMAATILCMSDAFFQQRDEQVFVQEFVSDGQGFRSMQAGTWYRPEGGMVPQASFGTRLKQVAERRGCSGGGEETVAVESVGGVLLGSAGSSEAETCGTCNNSSADGHYHCPNRECQKTYADETDVDSTERTKKCTCGFEFNC